MCAADALHNNRPTRRLVPRQKDNANTSHGPIVCHYCGKGRRTSLVATAVAQAHAHSAPLVRGHHPPTPRARLSRELGCISRGASAPDRRPAVTRSAHCEPATRRHCCGTRSCRPLVAPLLWSCPRGVARCSQILPQYAVVEDKVCNLRGLKPQHLKCSTPGLKPHTRGVPDLLGKRSDPEPRGTGRTPNHAGQANIPTWARNRPYGYAFTHTHVRVDSVL